MEVIDRARRPLRKELKKLLEEIERLLKESPVDKDEVNSHYEMIKEEYAKLEVYDEKAKDLLVQTNADEDREEEEYEKVREIRGAVKKLQSKMNQFLSQDQLPHGDLSSGSSSSASGDLDGFGVRLPKFEFRTFSGDLLDWLGFWSQFAKVDKHPRLEGSDKFGYLMMALEKGSEPYELVNAFPQTNENYPEAVKALTRRYGNQDVLLQVYIRELLKLVITNASSKEKLPIGTLYSKVDSHLRALKTLNLASRDPETWLYPLIESCLPKEILLTWMRNPSYHTNDDTVDSSRLDRMMEFLGSEVENIQKIGLAERGFQVSQGGPSASSPLKRKFSEGSRSEGRPNYGKSFRKSEPTSTLRGFQNVDRRDGSQKWEPTKGVPQKKVHLRGNAGRYKCIFCERNGHGGIECGDARHMSLEQRKKKVQEHAGCYICLERHLARDCRSNVRCQLCGNRHCTIMCGKVGESSTARKTSPSQSSNNSLVPRISQANQVRTCPVSLQTVQAMIVSGNQKRRARIFYDAGSQRSYILKSTARDLELMSTGNEVVAHELFGGSVTKRIVHNLYEIELTSIVGCNGILPYHCRILVRDQDKISSSIPTVNALHSDIMQELEKSNIDITDVGSDSPPIDILIGADVYGRLLTGNIKRLKCGQVAVETKLGWTLIGEYGGNFEEWNEEDVTTMSAKDFSISQLWDLDTIGVRDPTDVISESTQEEEIKQRFFKEIKRDESGRYIVKLPWREGHPNLPDNWNEAEKRLRRTTAKLKSIGLFEIYGNLFNEWEKEGFIEVVDMNSTSSKLHYVPHRAVVKNSLTTPVRPVFDASCKIGRVPSLNDCLHKGTNYIVKIPEVLLGFRKKKIGIISDIRKAFQMIGVDVCDRDVMRFLWWDQDGNIKVYRHKRVMFGATCSPFILGAVLDYHLNNLTHDEETGRILLRSMYVDNSVHSEDTIEEYKKFRAVSTSLLEECQMELRMWMTNIDEFEDPVTHTVSVLGVMWNRLEDVLFIKVNGVQMPEKITKRTVLSCLQKVFDPIGLTCPALIPIKVLIQRAFQSKLKWDEALPETDAKYFQSWIEEVNFLEMVKIPRRITDLDYDRGEWSLNVFMDASSSSYSAAVFLKVKDGNHVTVRLLSAKARVAPIKKVTIPRLELMGCLIGARMYSQEHAYLNKEGVTAIFRSDSTTALAWIRRDSQWGTFVDNRTKEINRLTDKTAWQHIPGNLNPADLPSRGCSPKHLYEMQWWKGPSWMYMKEEPTWSEVVNEEEVSMELKKSAISQVSMTAQVIEEAMISVIADGKQKSFQSWVRVIAFMKRFIYNCMSLKNKTSRKTGKLSHQETEDAEITLVKAIQHDAFGNKDEKEFRGLETFLDRNGLLCVKTRLVLREDLIVSNMPYVLPGKHPLVQQLIWDTHIAFAHAGVGFLVTKLRKKFWILKARKSIRSVVSRCYKCRRLNAKPVQTPNAPLPLDRVGDSGVFETVGIDLAGPMYLKNGRKVWLVIITCAVYRAVYLDLVDSCSTNAFIKCLGKFIKTHCRPKTIYTDNGTNFRGCSNLFRELDWDKITKEENVQPIVWKFNPPSGPWWGGWWERLIRTVKDLLHRTVGKGSLHRKELEETLKVIEEVMNGRPLTYASEDPEDLEPLTPNTFLKPFGNCRFPEGPLTLGDKLRFRQNYMKTLWNELKKRLQREYLSLLVSKSRKRLSRPLRVGELVVVANDLKRRWDWPLGRVLEILPGNDGIGRVARVKVNEGVLIRPVQRLHPLEVDIEAHDRHCMITRSKSK